MRSKISNICLDLDGTLIDSQPGIEKCIDYAITKLGISSPKKYPDFSWAIGLGLREVFSHIMGSTDPEEVEQAVRCYRERYSVTGVYENSLYPGISNFLRQASVAGYKIFLTTLKPTVYARLILDQHDLNLVFSGVYGSELNWSNDSKTELVKQAFVEQQLVPNKTLIVGDRKYDIQAAKDLGVISIGVTYGYGTKEELAEAGANFFAESAEQLVELLCKSA